MQFVQYSPSTPVVCTYFSGRVVRAGEEGVERGGDSCVDAEPGPELLAIDSRVSPSVVALDNCKNLRRASDLIGFLLFLCYHSGKTRHHDCTDSIRGWESWL